MSRHRKVGAVGDFMKPTIDKREIAKRSVIVSGHRTSVSVEDEFWDEFKQIASRDGKSVNDLISEIDRAQPEAANLSSALRLYVFKDVQSRAAHQVTYKKPAAA